MTLFCSRYLTDTESRYSPVEGESLALAYGLEKCKHFVLGCKELIVAVDHKPLCGLFNNRSLDCIPNSRLRNLKEKTLSYRFQIVHIQGVKNKVADALSRYPNEPAGEGMHLIDDEEIPVEQAAATIESTTAITLDKVASHTISDDNMRKLMKIIEDGFPELAEMPK